MKKLILIIMSITVLNAESKYFYEYFNDTYEESTSNVSKRENKGVKGFLDGINPLKSLNGSNSSYDDIKVSDEEIANMDSNFNYDYELNNDESVNETEEEVIVKKYNQHNEHQHKPKSSDYIQEPKKEEKIDTNEVTVQKIDNRKKILNFSFNFQYKNKKFKNECKVKIIDKRLSYNKEVYSLTTEDKIFDTDTYNYYVTSYVKSKNNCEFKTKKEIKCNKVSLEFLQKQTKINLDGYKIFTSESKDKCHIRLQLSN